MKKIFIVILSFLFLTPISLSAVSTSEVDYEVYDYIVDAGIDISGNMLVKEVIGIKGTYNGYIRDIVYKFDKLKEFDGTVDSFYGSKIYDATNIKLYKVGEISWDGELSYDVFNEEIKEFNDCTNEKLCYKESDITNGKQITLYNETIDDITYFYIEYLIGNIVVMHEDVSEIYFPFIGEDFDDDIRNYKLRVTLPSSTTEQIRVWTHGPLTGTAYFIEDKGNYYGGYYEIENLRANNAVDFRMTFPKSLIMVDHPFLKKSNTVALDKILQVEEERADEANKLRTVAKVKVYGTYIISGLYILITILLIVYIYIKYDKERKASFEGEYYRDFIDDYDVTVIEYLFDKKISEKGFSTSILNMIYKKNIKFEEISKKDFKLTKISENNLTDAEKEVMNIIFNKAGDKETTTLSKIKKYASQIDGTTSPFLSSYEIWKSKVTSDSIEENFYEKNGKIKALGASYSILGIVVLFLLFSVGIFNILTFLVVLLTVGFVIYVLTFNKRTIKGAEHYAKWSAFKRFLEDFGRFEEKELPEIVLWERYLVYASIFGIADKVGKTMKIKFNEMSNVSNDRDFIFDYMMWNNINNSINRTINSSFSTAHSKVAEATAREIGESTRSSGGGFGGGSSIGGGFGGGGGGRGF